MQIIGQKQNKWSGKNNALKYCMIVKYLLC